MKMYKKHWAKSGILMVGMLLLATLNLGGTGGCGGSSTGGGGGGTDETRNLTGSLSSSSLSSLKLKGKNTSLACTDVQVCCAGYDGSTAVATVNSDCSFELALPLNNFCYCAIFTGSDEDGNSCGDEYIASLGCSENGYSGAIPIYPDTDGGTDDIDIGEGDVEGTKIVAANNPCAQVDQDQDGSTDADDTDDDGDDTSDSEDDYNDYGCENLDEFDSNADNIPDLFQAIFGSLFSSLKVKGTADASDDPLASFFGDEDGDDVPDGCDKDFTCEATSADADGDCIPDDDDWCATDEDGDYIGVCADCDDSDPDPAVSIACYSDNYCGADNDGDGFGLCDDCDDENADSTYECWSDDFCSYDADGDGVGYCLDYDDSDEFETTGGYSSDFCGEDNDDDGVDICSDCNDFNAEISFECYAGEDSDCGSDGDGDGYPNCVDCDDDDDTVTDSCFSEDICDPDGDGSDCQEILSEFTDEAAVLDSAICSEIGCLFSCAESSSSSECISHAEESGIDCDESGSCSFDESIFTAGPGPSDDSTDSPGAGDGMDCTPGPEGDAACQAELEENGGDPAIVASAVCSELGCVFDCTAAGEEATAACVAGAAEVGVECDESGTMCVF